MTLLFGLFSPGGEAVPDGLLDRIEHGCDWPRDRALRHEAPGVAMLALQRDTVPRSRDAAVLGDDGTALMLSGRIDNRRELASRLGLGPEEGVDDAELVRAAWRADGRNFCRGLIGDFAIAVHDGSTRRLLLARDHCGTTPLYHARVGPFIAFSSAIEWLRHIPGIDLAWDERWIAETLAIAKVDVGRTAYRAISAVPPAHAITFDAGAPRIDRYWSLPECDVALDIGDREAVEEFRRLFDQAVECRLRARGDVACELSGGLDSASIAATADLLLTGRGSRLLAFSHGIPEGARHLHGTPEDERPLVAAMLAAFPRIEHRWTDDAVDSQVAVLGRTLVRHGAPPRNDMNAHAEDLPETLRTGDVRVLLSGFGGDQVVTSSGGGYLESLLEERDWPTLRAFMTDRYGPVRGMLRWSIYRSGVGGLGLARRSQVSLAERYDPVAQLLDPTFLAAQSASDPLDRHGHRVSSGSMRTREAGALGAPSLAYRLQDSAVGAAARGFVYRYPMLDIRLLAFAHQLPARFKRAPSMRRRMIRMAMRDRLPDEIRLRPGKDGSTFPEVGINAALHALELARLIAAHRDDPRVARYARIDLALETLRRAQGHDGFVGPLSVKHVLRLAFLCLWAERD